MSYLFMKALEQRPASYDAGIKRISGQDWGAVRERIGSEIKPGERVLELGCGPGTLAVELAQKGAQVTALDQNPAMLTFARGQAAEAGVKMDFVQHPLEQLNELSGQWDWVIASLSFSELRPIARPAVLVWSRSLLKDGGRLLVVDEVVPSGFIPKISYHLGRFFMGIVTRLRTRSSTRPLTGFEKDLEQAGYRLIGEAMFSPGSLKLWSARKSDAPMPEPAQLRVGWEFRDWAESFLLWLSSHFLKVPFPPGLYRTGNPGPDSPLLATCNYTLTVNMVRKYLKGIDAWLLVNDTRGVNVWCSAGEGNFSAREVAVTLAASQAERLVNRREVILPKLSLNGVRLREVKERSGFAARIGPVYAQDIPAYLADGNKVSPEMDRIRFNLWRRLWFGVPFALFMALIAGVVVLLSAGHVRHDLPLWFGVTSLLIAITYTWLPTRWHLVKGLILGGAMALAAGFYQSGSGADLLSILRSSLLLVSLGLFVTADFSGGTPVSNRTLVEREFKPIYLTLAGLMLLYIFLPKILEVWK
jgi:ubiquinone/menaquinone biosynthesis C-methylase UbiE